MNRRTVRARHGSQAGQSLVEVCVACIALVPLVIGLVYVGQYIHIKHTVQQSAREAAWDAAVAPSTYKVATPDASAEQTSLRARYFGDPKSSIQADPPEPSGFSDSLLVDYSGQRLLQPGQLTLSQYDNSQTPGIEGSVDAVIGKITSAVSKIPMLDGGEFPPDPEGYLTARVDAKTSKAKYFDPLDKLDLDFRSQTVLLADAWNADGAGEKDTDDKSDIYYGSSPIHKRVVREAMPPSAALLNGSLSGGIAGALNFVGSIPILNDFFPTKGLNIGRAAPDVVPYDKLKPYKK